MKIDNDYKNEKNKTIFGNEKINYIVNHKVINILRTAILYPCYRNFIENKIYGINKLKKTDYFPIKVSIIKSVKSRNSFITGITSFSIYSNMPIIFSLLYDSLKLEKDFNITVPHIILLLPTYIISYPLLINSNRKVMNDPCYLNIKNPLNLIRLMSIKNNYRGLYYHLLNSFISFLPLINLVYCYKLESIRFTYLFGKNEKGLRFSSYKEAKNFIKNNDTIKKGRASFNSYLLGYYLTLGFLFYEEYSKEGIK